MIGSLRISKGGRLEFRERTRSWKLLGRSWTGTRIHGWNSRFSMVRTKGSCTMKNVIVSWCAFFAESLLPPLPSLCELWCIGSMFNYLNTFFACHNMQICMVHKLGYGNWDELKAAFRTSPLFRFDWFVKSRTTQELARRCDTLIRLVEKENQEYDERERQARKEKKLAKVRFVPAQTS